MPDRMPNHQLIDWEALSQEEQIHLRIEYGHYLDQLPPTCALDQKQARFSYWLQQQGVHYAAQA